MNQHLDHAGMRRQCERERGGRLARVVGHTPADAKADKQLADHEIKKAFGQHDDQLHEHHKTHLKLRDGGHGEGGRSRRRLDRGHGRHRRQDGGAAPTQPPASNAAMQNAINAGLAKSLNPAPTQAPGSQVPGSKRGGRTEKRAEGGRTGHKSKSKAAHVNVIVGAGGHDQPVPVPVPTPAARPPMPPPRPPMAPPGAGLPPGAGGLPPGLARPPLAGAPGMMPPRARGGRLPHMTAGAHSGEGRLQKARAMRRSGGEHE